MKMKLQFVVTMVIFCALRATGSPNNSPNSANNSFNSYISTTSGSVLSPTSSTAQSLLETYLQTLPINEQQNVLTTIYQTRQHVTNSVDVEKEKLTTSSEMTLNSATNVASLGTESSQIVGQDVQHTNIVNSTNFLSTSTAMPNVNIQDNIEQPTIITVDSYPQPLGCGPNNREGYGIQKALDWLREKRVDYAWENDTHMVILAKEVNVVALLNFKRFIHNL
jgi:hypothetical protein